MSVSRNEQKFYVDAGRIAGALERIARALEERQYGFTAEERSVASGELAEAALREEITRTSCTGYPDRYSSGAWVILHDGDSCPVHEREPQERPPLLPLVDTTSSMQNAWVQDWLTRYFSGAGAPKRQEQEWNAYESVIETIQGSYSHADHQARR